MKRFLTFLLCLVLMTGCRAEPPAPSFRETEATEPSTSTEATLPKEQPGVPLLSQGEASGETGNLLYIPNSHVESMVCPEICLFRNSLLMYEHTLEGMLQLKRISLEDGCLMAEAAYPVTPSVKVQVGNGFIGLCDSGSGQVLILNDLLGLETTYEVPLEGEDWYMDQELQTLFVFVTDEGLLSYDLVAGQTRWLLDNAAFVQSYGMESGYVLFSYTDRTDKKTYSRSLNLSTANIETLPLEGTVDSGVRNGEKWLLRQDIASGAYEQRMINKHQ